MLHTLTKKDSDYPQVGTMLLLAFCGYVIIWYLQIGYRRPALGEIRFEFIYAAVLSLFAIGMASKDKIPLDCPAIKWAILLFLVMIISMPFSFDIAHSWTIFIDRVVKFSFMAFFIICFVRSPQHLIFFLAAFLLACLKMGQEGLVGQFSGNMVWESQGIMRLHGSTPLYRHPNSFAGMALGTIPFIIYLFPIAHKYIKVIFLVQLFLALNIVLHTGSRTGYVAFFIMLIFMFIKSTNKIKTILAIIVLTVISMNFIDDQYVARFMTIYTGQEIEGGSMDARKDILEDAVAVFIQHPLGVGVQGFPAARQQLFGRSADTHNLYLEVATNLGIQGLFVFIGFVWIMIKKLKNILHSVREQKNKISYFLANVDEQHANISSIKKHHKDLNLIEATSKAVILFLIVRLSLGLFGMDLYEIYWWFSLGLVVSLYNMNKYSRSKTQRLSTIKHRSNT